MTKRATSKKVSGTDIGTPMRLAPPSKPKIHSFTRRIALQDIVKTVGDRGHAIAFTLADLPGFSEFQALFDFYRIDWVDYTFVIKTTQGAFLTPTIFIAEDHDDDDVPSLTALMEKQSSRMITFGGDRTSVTLRVVPNVLRQVFQTGVTPGYERAPPGTWLDCAQPSIKHYGLKYWIQNFNSSTANDMQVTLRYGLSFKEAL